MMAFLDPSGIKDDREILDDCLAFLEAVRAAFLVSQNGIAPSSKLFGAIFHILKDTTSLELAMTSYQLLIELDKRFPRASLLITDNKAIRLFLVEEAWSPFYLGSTSAYNGTGQSCSSDLLDSLAFTQLIMNIAKQFDEFNFKMPERKLVGNMMLFRYLIIVLERDFVTRCAVYKETKNWSLLRESILSMLLCSRKINYKGLMKDCVSFLSKECSHASVALNNMEKVEGSAQITVDSCDVALLMSYFELKKGTYTSLQKLFSLIMELDNTRKEADTQSQTSRVDGARTPLIDIILDELAYDEDLFSNFLQVFSDPKWKLEIILLFFSKYLSKPSICTRRSNSTVEDPTLDSILSCFSTDTSTKGIIKKINSDIAQMLLAYAFQAYLNLQHHNEHTSILLEKVGGGTTLQMCKDMVAAFHNLRRADKNMDILPIGKQALFTAAAIMSKKS